jgi:predicted ABC-type ATPase
VKLFLSGGRTTKVKVVGVDSDGRVEVEHVTGMRRKVTQSSIEMVSAPKALIKTSDIADDPKLPIIDDVQTTIVPKRSSIEAGVDKESKWTSPSKQLHQKIISEHLNHAKNVDKPRLVFIAGGPASGKSTIVEGDNSVVSLPEDPVTIDVDKIKGMIPAYQERVAAGDPSAASYVHEESSALGSSIRKLAVKQGSHVVLDGVGNSSFTRVQAKIEDARKRGYKIEAHYVTIPTDVAIARNHARFKETGRLVPDSVIENAHRKVTDTVLASIEAGLFDEFDLWDTDTNFGPPVLIATANGTDLNVVDQERWDKFVAKGTPKPDAAPITQVRRIEDGIELDELIGQASDIEEQSKEENLSDREIKGIEFTKFALQGHLFLGSEDNRAAVFVAESEGLGLAGALNAYVYEIDPDLDGDVASLYIDYLGSTGVQSGTGTALVKEAAKYAASLGMPLVGSPSGDALKFWVDKIGWKPDPEGIGADIYGFTLKETMEFAES